jgi:transcriptional regulator with XRE-family HTH domain
MGRRSKTTGEVLSDARRDRALTQAAVAEKLERSQSWVSRLESDEVDPSIATLRRIAEVYGVPLATLIPA